MKKEVRYPGTFHDIERNAVQGELVVDPHNGDRESLPFEGWLTSTGFLFNVSWQADPALMQELTFFGSLSKGTPLTGNVLQGGRYVGGSFALTLKK